MNYLRENKDNLLKTDVYDLYFRRFNEDKSTFRRVIETVRGGIYADVTVGRCFSWASTKEGHDFWDSRFWCDGNLLKPLIITPRTNPIVRRFNEIQ